MYGAEDVDLTTLKYQKVSLSFHDGVSPDGAQAYESIVKQLISEVQKYLRVGDMIGFFVFKRPTVTSLSIHLRDKPFADAVLNRPNEIDKNQLSEAVKEWRARAASEYGTGKQRYFGRKHVWLVKRRTPTFIQTTQNPVTISDGHGGVTPDYIDINEPCKEGA